LAKAGIRPWIDRKPGQEEGFAFRERRFSTTGPGHSGFVFATVRPDNGGFLDFRRFDGRMSGDQHSPESPKMQVLRLSFRAIR
jgi:hypothetical protein